LPSSDLSTTAGRPLTRPALAANLGGFTFNGVLMGIYGPILVAVSTRFHVSIATAGTLVGIHFLGAMFGAAAFWLLGTRVPSKRLLSASYTWLAVGLFALIMAGVPRSFPLFCFGALAAGIGFGGLDYGLSQIFAAGYGKRKTAMLNLLHGCFGIGTTLGPLLVAFMGGARYDYIFAFGLLTSFAGIFLGHRGLGDAVRGTKQSSSLGHAIGYGLVSSTAFLFVLLYVVHLAVQSSIGEWEPAQLRASGYSGDIASLWTAAYWGGIACARLLVASGRIHIPPRNLLIICGFGTCLAAVLSALPPIRPVAYVLFGFFIGPIFPVGLSWLSTILRRPDDGIAAVVVISLVGGVIFPPLIGMTLGTLGLGILPPALLGLSLCTAGITVMLPRSVTI
jgi:MFS transporter, FHS family, glucose/mannose:H+ symporter